MYSNSTDDEQFRTLWNPESRLLTRPYPGALRGVAEAYAEMPERRQGGPGTGRGGASFVKSSSAMLMAARSFRLCFLGDTHPPQRTHHPQADVHTSNMGQVRRKPLHTNVKQGDYREAVL